MNSNDVRSTRFDASAFVLQPRPLFSDGIFAAFIRDTRATHLDHRQRFSYFPAFPFCVVSWCLYGACYEVSAVGDMVETTTAGALPKIYVSGPRTKPAIVWTPDDALVMSVGFYPQAFAALTRCNVANLVDVTLPIRAVVDDSLVVLFRSVADANDPKAAFERLQDGLAERWPMSSLERERPRMKDWEAAVACEAAGPPGTRGKRQIERRVKKWTGHARRGLASYLHAEEFFEQVLPARKPAQAWSVVALDANFSDQSHMIRVVKRITGFTPRSLSRRLGEPSFWCYRLLGECLAR